MAALCHHSGPARGHRYMQLRFAGVLEVVRIKKEGYPYREQFERFFERRVVQSGLYRVLKLPATFDNPTALKSACEHVCRTVLGDPAVQSTSEKAERTGAMGNTKSSLRWQLGNTMVFGKDDLPTRIIEWHQRRVANDVRSWFRCVSLKGHCSSNLVLAPMVKQLIVTFGQVSSPSKGGAGRSRRCPAAWRGMAR